MSVNILFLGAKPIGFQCLKYLITHAADLNISIKGVLSDNNSRLGKGDIFELASSNGIPIITDLDAIAQMPDIDYLISVQYNKILKKEHIESARKLAINLHMAPLPELRGCNQFSFAILKNMKEFGTTLHRLEEGIDNGAIIAERRFEIPHGCLVNELYELTCQESLLLFQEEIGRILKGEYTLVPQHTLIPERGTSLHFRRDIEEIKQIDLTQSPGQIHRQIRATSMPGFEPPYIMVENKKIYLVHEDIYKHQF